MKNIGNPELAFDISESNIPREELEAFVKKTYGNHWCFDRTDELTKYDENDIECGKYFVAIFVIK